MTSRIDIELVSDSPKTRQCGSCSACCRGWLNTEVNGEKLTVGRPCRHVVKQGCSIHETRPQFPCREFVCGWLFQESPLPDWMRPNHCGAIVFPWYEWRYHTVINAVAVGDKIPKRTLDWLMAYAKEQRRPLIFVEHIRKGNQHVGSRWSGFGPPAFMRYFEQATKDMEKSQLLQMFSANGNDG